MGKLGILVVIFLMMHSMVLIEAYLPGLAAKLYCTEKPNPDTKCETEIHVYANRLNSDETVVPYEYSSFDFCVPDDVNVPTENLGQVVFGERIEASSYHMTFGKDEKCKKACTMKYDLKKDPKKALKIAKLKRSIRYNYQQHWIVDNMPATWCYMTATEGSNLVKEQCTTGFPLGCYAKKGSTNINRCPIKIAPDTVYIFNHVDITVEYNDGSGSDWAPDTVYIFNHVDITVEYNDGSGSDWGKSFRFLEAEGGRIVSVKVVPRSIRNYNEKDVLCGEKATEPMIIPAGKANNFSLTYTYSVKFIVNNNITWSSRWDYIFNSMPKPSIQWVSIVNSMVIVLFLSGMVAMILMRTLYRDIARYNQMDNVEDAQEEFGWKLVHGDVFRAPRKGMLLCVLTGSGSQIFFMSCITLVVACFGFLSPANRGALTTTGLVLYVCLGTPAGYISARIYKSFGGERWKFNVLCTAFLCPGLLFGMVFLLNLILWIMKSSAAIPFTTLLALLALWFGISVPLTFVGAYFGFKKSSREKGIEKSQKSSAAIPFTTLLALLALWFGISVPLTFVGAYFGFKKSVIEQPVRTNQIPRQIPDMSCYTKPLPGIIMGGVLPFGCIFIQLFFILTSIWSHRTFYMFGLLFLVFVILIITCSEATILLCYFHLCAEDYHWWWRSFLTSGSTAFYFLIYCIHFFFAKLEMHGVASTFLYFGYTLIIMFLFFLLCGTIGFLTTYWFMRKIYGSVKVD